MSSYIIWIPFEFPPGSDISLDRPMELDVCGYSGTFRKQLRFKGLEIRGIPSEDTARHLLSQVSGALLYTIIGRGPHMRFDLEPAPIVYKEDDFCIYSDRVSLIRGTPLPFHGGHTVVYRDDKKILGSPYATVEAISDLGNFLDVFLKALKLPSMKNGISDRSTTLAAELYCSSPFETSDSARFVTLCTVLEVLAPTKPVLGAVADQIDRWIADARELCDAAGKQAREAFEVGEHAEAQELQVLEGAWETAARRLGNLKTESITSALKSRVEALLQLDKQDDAKDRAARVATLYGKRHRVVHRGQAVSLDELFELDEIARMVLISAIRNVVPH